eukprot:Opistho-2@59337
MLSGRVHTGMKFRQSRLDDERSTALTALVALCIFGSVAFLPLAEGLQLWCAPGTFVGTNYNVDDPDGVLQCMICAKGLYMPRWNNESKCLPCDAGDICADVDPSRGCVSPQKYCPLGGAVGPRETGWVHGLPPLDVSSLYGIPTSTYISSVSSKEHVEYTVTPYDLMHSSSFSANSPNLILLITYFVCVCVSVPVLLRTDLGLRALGYIDHVYEVPTRDISVPLTPVPPSVGDSTQCGGETIMATPVRTRDTARAVFTFLAIVGAAMAAAYVVEDFVKNRYIEERTLGPITALNEVSVGGFNITDDVMDTFPVPVFTFLLLGTSVRAENTTLSVYVEFDENGGVNETVNIDDLGKGDGPRASMRIPPDEFLWPSNWKNLAFLETHSSRIGNWAAWVTDALDVWDDARPADPSVLLKEGKGQQSSSATKKRRIKPAGMESLRRPEDIATCRAMGRGHCTIVMMRRSVNMVSMPKFTFGTHARLTFRVGSTLQSAGPVFVQAMRMRIITLSWRTEMMGDDKRNALTWIEGGATLTQTNMGDLPVSSFQYVPDLRGVLYTKTLLRGPKMEPMSRGFDLQVGERSEGTSGTGPTFKDAFLADPYDPAGTAILRVDITAPPYVLQIDIRERISIAAFLTALASLPAAVVGAGGVSYSVFVLARRWGSRLRRHVGGHSMVLSSLRESRLSTASLDEPLISHDNNNSIV